MDLENLYQEIIIDHYKNPRNRGRIPDEKVLADEENPMCGDQVRLTASVENGRISSIRFDGKGCAISQASASMMTEALSGKTIEEAADTIRRFIGGMTGEEGFNEDEWEEIAALGGVRNFPLRIKCATMSWHGMEKVLGRIADSSRGPQ